MEFLIQFEEIHGRLPPALISRPNVAYDSEYLRAFQVLGNCRQYGLSPNPLSLQDIYYYLRMFPTDDVDAFLEIIQDMDNYYLVKSIKPTDSNKSEE